MSNDLVMSGICAFNLKENQANKNEQETEFNKIKHVIIILIYPLVASIKVRKPTKNIKNSKLILYFKLII